MIINPRGTSGSGKSYIAKRVVNSFSEGNREEHRILDRKQPLYYTLHRVPLLGGGQEDEVRRPIRVLGHYNAACGGCDTITSQDEILRLCKEGVDLGHHVLYEGLLLSAEHRRAIELHEYACNRGESMLVICLDTSIDECVASINARRAARGNHVPVAPENTIAKAKGVKTAARRLEEAGVTVEWANRERAWELTAKFLGL